MRKTLGMVTVALLLNSGPAFSEEWTKKELEILKQRIEKLEQEHETGPQIHGGVVLYYQGAHLGKIEGENIPSPSGTGYVADLEISFKLTEEDEFYMRLHAGEGSGADKIFDVKEGALFANLNTLSDDNPENEATFKLLEAYYTRPFLDGKVTLSVGKTEPPVFIDDNEYANNEYSQFVGKPFVNNPIIDGEFQFAPIVGVVISPVDKLEISAVLQSNEQSKLYWNGSEWSVKEKSLYDNVFDNPFFALQVKVSPEIAGLSGNYRLYYWNDSADHIKVGEDVSDPTKKPSTDKGWGVGISIDQEISEKAGIFARAAWGNDKVYEVEQFYSVGLNLNGIFPSREKDILGVGVAALIPNDKLENSSTEWHFEAYYRTQISENLSITPDFQLVLNPQGDSSNDNIFTAMVKAEFSF
ncbi:carbohydrate porin [Phorcysia thermohydrogeniphila]|uniref:Carbohydrate-selective porin (OprB family) n=1 Tax=Phorcysia thermohydrogeniphila TaxID=936138 RepID=A0A4R1G936_9BACT|nr:carbohydrate porin [Phorcysia thermohydrogeniphila]TCK04667.1 carbohydrate-selective porin (OprB family) [Phorcysia thermohydrogeniphila]